MRGGEPGRVVACWVRAVVVVGLAVVGAGVLGASAGAAVDREAIVSYDEMRGGAPHHGYFVDAWQSFTALSSVITHVGVTVGNPTLSTGIAVGYTVRVRLCDTPPDGAGGCHALAQAEPQIVNYGNSYADIGDISVHAGGTYWLVWFQPSPVGATSWVTFWWQGGSTISASDRMQMVVKGYNPPEPSAPVPIANTPPAPVRYAIANATNVNRRSGPGTGYAVLGELAAGAPIDIACQTTGEEINGSPIWDRLTDSSFVSDWFTTTPVVGDYSPGIPRCDGAPPEVHPATPGGRWSIVAGAPVNERGGPSVQSAVRGTLVPGARFDIVCQTYGSVVFGSPVWDQLPDGGWIADYFTNTPVYAAFSPGLPTCPGTGPRPGASDATSPYLAAFERGAAVDWAEEHATDPESTYLFRNDCADFVSSALHHGGMLFNPWWFFTRPRIADVGYSRSWAVAENFIDAMTSNGVATRSEIPDLTAKTVVGALPGDIIAWHDQPNDDGIFTHVAMVVAVTANGLTLTDQHSPSRWHGAWNVALSLYPRSETRHYRAALLHLNTP